MKFQSLSLLIISSSVLWAACSSSPNLYYTGAGQQCDSGNNNPLPVDRSQDSGYTESTADQIVGDAAEPTWQVQYRGSDAYFNDPHSHVAFWLNEGYDTTAPGNFTQGRPCVRNFINMANLNPLQSFPTLPVPVVTAVNPDGTIKKKQFQYVFDPNHPEKDIQIVFSPEEDGGKLADFVASLGTSASLKNSVSKVWCSGCSDTYHYWQIRGQFTNAKEPFNTVQFAMYLLAQPKPPTAEQIKSKIVPPIVRRPIIPAKPFQFPDPNTPESPTH